MAVVYTVGDVTLTEIRPNLFTVAAEGTGTLAYFDTLARAEHHGHELAKGRGVSLWRVNVTPPRSTLIASYRQP